LTASRLRNGWDSSGPSYADEERLEKMEAERAGRMSDVVPGIVHPAPGPETAPLGVKNPIAAEQAASAAAAAAED